MVSRDEEDCGVLNSIGLPCLREKGHPMAAGHAHKGSTWFTEPTMAFGTPIVGGTTLWEDLEQAKAKIEFLKTELELADAHIRTVNALQIEIRNLKEDLRSQGEENKKLKEYELRTRDTICWDVECHHQAEALNQMAAQQHKIDEYRDEAARCRAIAKFLCDKLEVRAVLTEMFPSKTTVGGIGMFICAPNLNEHNLGGACKIMLDDLWSRMGGKGEAKITHMKVQGTEADKTEAPMPPAFKRGDDPANEICLFCSKHISKHYGGTEYRCFTANPVGYDYPMANGYDDDDEED